MQRQTIVIAVSVLVSLAAAAQPVPPQRVPADMLDGATIRMPECQCSLTAPDEKWVWVRPSVQRRWREFYMADSPDGSQSFAIMLLIGHLDEYARDLKSSTVKVQHLLGNEVQRFSVAKVDKPVPNSRRYSFSKTDASGKPLYTFGYMLPTAHRIVHIEYDSEIPSEPASFVDFVNSFKITQ